MDAHPDTHLSQGDTSQNALVESFIMDRGHESVNAGLDEDSVIDNFSLPSPRAYSGLVADGGDVEAHEEQTNRPIKFDQELDHEHSHTFSRSNSDQISITCIPDEVSPMECGTVPSGGPTPLIIIKDIGVSSTVCLQESPLLRARTVSSELPPRDREVDSDGCSSPVQMLHTVPDLAHTAGPEIPTNEEKQEDFDYPCEAFLPSLPPSSSPPQLFSSSPCASSQSSVGGIEPSKPVPAIEVCESPSCGGVDDDHVILVFQDDSPLDFNGFRGHETAELATASETDKSKSCLQIGPTSPAAGASGLLEKRIYDESDGSQPIKRLKLDTSLYLPPAPKRATLASQHQQFKKLIAPFRPPLKLPVVTDGPAQSTNTRRVVGNKAEMNHDKIDPGISTVPLQYKISNAPRPVTQFRSPLVNRTLPTDSRTIRLTPTLQALERRLQALKRAIKVKEDNEEEVLIGLVGKWIEAGREVAHDVWNVTKDAGDFMGKATFTHGSCSWGSTPDRSMPWGWNGKSEDPSEEAGDCGPSEASYTERWPAPAEDDVGCNTLGTMLRQLGIDPEIFGWDDDKETFSD